MDGKTTDDLVKIAAAGGGFRISAARPVNDLVRIAAAAANGGAKIIIAKAAAVQTMDLVRIASAGKGRVFFE